MEDLDDVRRATGTVADFSGWPGINGSGDFAYMKTKMTEKVIEPKEVEETIENNIETPKEPPRERVEPPRRPGVVANSINQNALLEVKNLAVRLLPTVDKVGNNSYNDCCEAAIEYAFTFVDCFNKKVEELNG